VIVLHTLRLDLIPASVGLLNAELASVAELAEFLGANVSEEWPPGEYDADAIAFFRMRLLESPDAAGWYAWYVLERSVGGRTPLLIGAGGYFGPPGTNGIVEIGYSIVPAFEGRGYATEVVGALVARAFSFPDVVRVIAHTDTDNHGSAKVLLKNGFSLSVPESEAGKNCFVRERRECI
jgi:[ribosomal protein S5]-alanine N-acetyltransferase